MFPTNSERLIGISDAFSAFVYGYPSSCPRAQCTPNKSVPTLRYTRRHGPVFTGHACRHLPSAVPWISEDRLFKRADFLAAPHHAHLFSEHFSECDFANPWNTAWGLLRSWHDVPVLFQNPAWLAQTDTAVSLWVSRAKYQFRLQSSSWPFWPQSDVVGIWSRDLGVMATLSIRQKMPFFVHL